MGNWALPGPTCTALEDEPCRRKSSNPALVLDRLLDYPCRDFGAYEQSDQKSHLETICEAMRANAAALNPILDVGWDALVDACDGAETFRLSTVWRMAMHLSRATALENASLCLHPVYGFPYLSGTGLKGVARASAEACADDLDNEQFTRVFGSPVGKKASSEMQGAVVFLEAWPERISGDGKRPTIEIDIVNDHHREYYGTGGETPPGDWESPVPVYFLTVAPGVTFRFAVAKALPNTRDDDVTRAREWLTEGLRNLGFGAKTAAGYGYFAPTEDRVDQGPARDPIEHDLVAEFKSQHSRLASQEADRSAAGNAIAALEDVHDGDARAELGKWIHEHLKRTGLLDDKPKRKPLTYGERLQQALKKK